MEFETNSKKGNVSFSFSRDSGISFLEADSATTSATTDTSAQELPPDLERGNAVLNLELPEYMPIPPVEDEKTFKFLSISAAAHLVTALAITLVSIQMALNKPKEDIVEIQILSAKGASTVAAPRAGALGGATMQTVASTPKSANLPITKEDVLVKPKKAAAPPVKTVKLKSVAKAQPLLAKESPVITKVKAKKATIDDIESPNLDIAKDNFEPKDLEEKDIFADLERERKKHEAELMARELKEMKELENSTQSMAHVGDSQLSKLQSMNAGLDREMADRQKALLSGVQGAGRGVGAKDSNSTGAGSNLGGKAISGGTSGSQSSQEALGSPTGVRSIEQLRQMPGNLKPDYASDDRYNHREGMVSFVAYVGHDGKIQKMLLRKTTGHRSLDAKALAAIKNWKFYPGQEGWVEIPFNWSLKGSPELKGPILRRASAQR